MWTFLRNPKLRRTFFLLLAAAGVLMVLAVLLWSHADTISDRDKMTQLIEGAGPRGPLIFMALQILQVVLAPIPGQVIGFVGGYLFGTLLGTTYSMIGTTIGFAIVFTLSRWLGRPFVEYFVAKHHMEKFDYLASTKGVWVLLLVFFLPLLPDAMVGYLAGLTKIKIPVLLVISFLGRFPSILLLSLAGSEAAAANYATVTIIFVLTAIAGFVAYIKRKQLEQFVRQFDT